MLGFFSFLRFTTFSSLIRVNAPWCKHLALLEEFALPSVGNWKIKKEISSEGIPITRSFHVNQSTVHERNKSFPDSEQYVLTSDKMFR